VICDMMGIPDSDRGQIAQWTDAMLSLQDRTLPAAFDEYAKASVETGAYGMALAEDRRQHPREDLTTSLVQAEVDGERLTSAEIASFFILLVFAGVETSRNAISHGVLALTRYPEQRRHWWSDFSAVSRTAVEEIVRWASPVVYMRRTLTEDLRLGDTEMAAGDKVTMWYTSANRDEAKFDNPWMFDVRRHPNPHFGYGGGGVHFCLGANFGPPRDQRGFRGIAPPNPRYRGHRGTRAAGVAVRQRDQAAARQLDPAAMSPDHGGATT
jgi:methyl-branched lipid omega-hydroxylase